jgi:hypothetical protein
VAVAEEATEVVMHQEVVDVSEETLNQKATVAEAAVVTLVAVAEVVDFHQEKVVEISKAVATSKVEVTSNAEDQINQVETEQEEVQEETIVNLTAVEAMVGERNTKNVECRIENVELKVKEGLPSRASVNSWLRLSKKTVKLTSSLSPKILKS